MLFPFAVVLAAATAAQPPQILSPLNNLQDMFTHGDGFLMCAMGNVGNQPQGCQPTNSTTQAKFLGKMESVDACASACSAFVYRGVFPCRSFTFFHSTFGNSSKGKGWRRLCYARIDDVWANSTHPGDADVTSGLRMDLLDCESAHQCEMNGKCVAGKCMCAQGWRGRFCQTLELMPAKRGNGYHRANTTSWGGSIVSPEQSGLDKYQLIVAEFALNCGFLAWYEVSRIVRASSPTADGPYEFEEVIKPRFAHGPAVVRVPSSDQWLLYHIGDGIGGELPAGLNCTNGTTPAGVMPGPSYTDCGKPKCITQNEPSVQFQPPFRSQPIMKPVVA